ncbi:MAG: hypothetical protein ACHRXM_14960 [Isosphaerales bacterium]
MFRRVYPFSPALVQTLIAVSSVLQRERTALKVMVQLLVDHRDTLRVGDIVPVGDLFDVIAHGDEAFSQDMAIHFDNAKRLYHQKLLPLLEKPHGRREDLEKLPYEDPKRVAFRNDDRLVKTLLLAALVPEVESLRSLNAERLAALNHGTIKTPIEGKEGQEVLRRCRTWAASVGEIQVGQETNPTISIQLSGVDTESIIKQAEREDNQGNRIRLVRQMLFEKMGVQGEGELEQHYQLLWKNTKRTCVVLFKNIRELSDSSLENGGGDWKLIIDFPFDQAGHGPRDDLSKLESFKGTHPNGAKTFCWVPAFFSQDAQKDLGLLVILKHVLTGERFGQYASQLSPQDRQSARSLLENQRGVLRVRVQSHLDTAYGLDALIPGSLDTTHDLELSERFVSLWPGFEPRPPVAANLSGAINHFVSQALEHEFPAAPTFEVEIKSINLKKVFEVVSEATRSTDGRAPVDRVLRPLVRGIANPLKLGEMGLDATHFVIGQHWKNYFARKAAETGGMIEVRQLKKWIDEPKAMGLPKEVEDLVVLTFAQQTNRSYFVHNVAFEATLGNVPDPCELRTHELPPQEQWDLAVQRSGSIFGVAVSPLRKVSNLSALTTKVKGRAGDGRTTSLTYCQRIRDRLEKLGLGVSGSARLSTATATLRLIEGIHLSSDDGVVGVLARAEVATSESAMGECLNQAGTLAGVLDATGWELFETIARLSDDRKPAADAIRSLVAETLRSDEQAKPLGAALKEAQSKALKLLTSPQPPPPKLGRKLVDQGSEVFLGVSQAKEKLNQLDKLAVNGRHISITINWRIEEDTKP